MEPGSVTGAVGTKFHEDGQVRYFPGNSIIAPLEQNRSAFGEIAWAQSVLLQTPIVSKYAFLPPHSFHMTVFDLLCDQVRDPNHWSTYLSTAANLRETDRFLEDRVARIDPPAAIRLRFVEMSVRRHPSVTVAPATPELASELRTYRDRLSESTGVRHPGHDAYQYHISLGYLLENLANPDMELAQRTEEKVTERLKVSLACFEVPSPSMVYFDHMHAFHRDKTDTIRWSDESRRRSAQNR